MVRTATQNKSVFTDIAECLRRQHNELHLKESRRSPQPDNQAFKGFRPQHRTPWKATNIRHPPKRRNFERTAHMAAEDGDEEYPCCWNFEVAPGADDEDEEDNIFAYNVITCTLPE